MGSKKRSAWARQRADFEESLFDGTGDLDAAFAAEDEHRSQMEERHDAALRYKACERKKRYPTRDDALDSLRACQKHGSRDLHVYRCPYCRGWHLTHKAPQDDRHTGGHANQGSGRGGYAGRR